MPPTLPLPNQITDKLDARFQAVRYTCVLKEVRQFRAYCCDIDSDSIMGVAKEPVPIISVTPNPVCLGAAISWDISASYAPGSTLTSWNVDFGDLTADASGADFPNDTTSGSHTYAAAGTYTITVTVEEGTGRTQESEVQVTVVECGLPGAGLPLDDLWTYASTEGSGVYFIDWMDTTPDWEGKNTGLEGDSLDVRHIVLDPNTKHLPASQHVLYIATKDGVYKSTNGGSTWAKFVLPEPSNLEFLDDPAATLDELEYAKVILHPTDKNTIFIIAYKEA